MFLNQYLAELKKISLLTLDEEQIMWQGYKEQGDFECRRQIIEHYQPLVFKIAMQWRTTEPTFMDILQEGTVGLIESVENYDHNRGVAFSIYAVHRIRGRMINYMERDGKRNWTYIDSPLDGDDADTLADYLVDAQPAVAHQAEHNYLVEQVKRAMNRLPAKEQLVLNGVFVEEREVKQLAETMDISVSHIYRLQKQGIRRVRGMLSKFMQHW